MRILSLFALLAACTPSDSEDAPTGDGTGSADGTGSSDGGGTTTDDGGSTDDGGGTTQDVDTSVLSGEVPDEELPAPDFAATNLDGAARSREDILGHPTVMWFYPAAGTAG